MNCCILRDVTLSSAHDDVVFPLFFSPRHAPCREPMYYANTGYALAPATSTNDSEQQSMSSDAETVSLTDSSVYVLSLLLLHRLLLFLFPLSFFFFRSKSPRKCLAGTQALIPKMKKLLLNILQLLFQSRSRPLGDLTLRDRNEVSFAVRGAFFFFFLKA